MIKNDKNPYSLMFGKEPNQVISRSAQKSEIIEMFSLEPMTEQIAVITGVRGSGKTVLMTSIAKELEKDPEWILVELNPELDMLVSLASKLSSHKTIARWLREAKINLSFFGIELGVQGTMPIPDIEIALEKMLSSLQKHGKKVLVTIDEVVNNSAIKIFAHSFQILVRKDLPIFLLMTGLYENIYNLQNEKSLTFLYRAPKVKMRPLNMMRISENYQIALPVDQDTAMKMAKITKGYPFAFQVLGYLVWRNKGYTESVLSEYLQYLSEYVYEKIWSELSKKDKELLYAMTRSETGKVQEIQNILGIAHNQFTPYQRRLLQKGVIESKTHGYLEFSLPMFREYVKECYLL